MAGMLKSLKAILAGFLFIVIVVLVMQLAYIFLAVGYNSLAGSYPVLNTFSGWFKYLIGIPVLVLVIFAGAYISAALSPKRPVVHAVLVALMSAAAMIVPTLEESRLTTTGIVVLILITLAGAAGGLYWQKSRPADPA